jgi:hypothetical protein
MNIKVQNASLQILISRSFVYVLSIKMFQSKQKLFSFAGDTAKIEMQNTKRYSCYKL